MALELKHSYEEGDDCTSWDFTDDSGVYNITTNPTGYGSPNLASTAVTKATISIYPYGATVPYIFTFTIASGTITVATVTNPAGTVTTITSLLTSTVFPFSTASPFVIIADWLGFGVDSSFTSGAFYTEYAVNDTTGTPIYISSTDDLMVCTTCCCIKNMGADLSTEDCGCSEGNAKLENAITAKMFMDSAIWAMENGEPDKAQENLLFAQSLCTAGCGCS